jgi:hypothetical protein
MQNQAPSTKSADAFEEGSNTLKDIASTRALYFFAGVTTFF